ACWAAATPERTKMPVPMMHPMPRSVRSQAVRQRLRPVFASTAMGLVRIRSMKLPAGLIWNGMLPSCDKYAQPTCRLPEGARRIGPMALAFVTGGSGYLGRNLIRALVADGVGVRALVRSDAAAAAVAAIGAQPVPGDLLDRRSFSEGVHGCTFFYH